MDRHRPGYQRPNPPKHRPGYQRPHNNSGKHRPGYKQKRTYQPKPLNPHFIDGEGMHEEKDSYVYLSVCNTIKQTHSLLNLEGLSSSQIFHFIDDLRYIHGTLVGYALNYDIENWLKDIPDDAYLALRRSGAKPVIHCSAHLDHDKAWDYAYSRSKDGTLRVKGIRIALDDGLWTISWIPSKKFSLQRIGSTVRKSPLTFEFKLDNKGKVIHINSFPLMIYDVFGFFQKKFTKALDDWGFTVDETISQGKSERGEFNRQGYENGSIQKYATAEGIAGAKLVDKFYTILKDSYEKAHMEYINKNGDLSILKPSRNQLYGPGALANSFINAFKTDKDYPVYIEDYHDTHSHIKEWEKVMNYDFFTEEAQDLSQHGWAYEVPTTVKDQKWQDSMRFPFLWSYFGGRIESAAIGYFPVGYDYDMHSAYSTALIRLPSLKGLFPKFVKKNFSRLIKKRAIGMYRVQWNFPQNWDWYPFPFRNTRSSISFPRQGQGWILSPELYAVIDTLGDSYITVDDFYGYPDTAFGDGLTVLPQEKMSESGIMVEHLMDLRLKLKALGDPANVPLKLIPNSLYGKFIQQIGRTINNLGGFNPLVASWCTSYTRAMIWREIAGHKDDHTIVAVQTDGIFSTIPLEAKLGVHLGEWECEKGTNCTQIMAGVYSFTNSKGKEIVKQRGLGNVNWKDVLAHFRQTSEPYIYEYTTFVTRLMELIQHEKLSGQRFQWPTLTKKIGVDIGTKRQFSIDTSKPLITDELIWTKPLEYGHQWLPSVNTLVQGWLPSLPYLPSFTDEITEEYLKTLADIESEGIEEFPAFFGE